MDGRRVFTSEIRNPKSEIPRSGFTLVEMLVAVGLVLLMMTLFATIFQFATQGMSLQKGVAENDQRVRLVMTVLRGDFEKRTMVDVGPFAGNEDVMTDPTAANVAHRRGYFYIAENDPDDDTDDVLQFTVEDTTGTFPYYGAARILLPETGAFPPATPPPATWVYGQDSDATSYPNYPPASVGGPAATIPATAFPTLPHAGLWWFNQPEFDDARVIDQSVSDYPRLNGVGSSSAAEISYFLRHGTLYRRVMLIRQPPSITPTLTDGDPKDDSGNLLSTDMFDPERTGAPTQTPLNFYTYFDYSAHNEGANVKWHTVAALNGSASDLDYDVPTGLGKPNFRFGHRFTTGVPREFVGNFFIGRFTHEETSFQDPNNTTLTPDIRFFGYPGKVGAAGSQYPDPYDPATTLNYETATGKVREYSGGTRSNGNVAAQSLRVSEDILMTGVHRFDIKVWDEAASFGPDGIAGSVGNTVLGADGTDDGAFVDVGHSGFFDGTTDTYNNTTGAPGADGVPDDLSFYGRNTQRFLSLTQNATDPVAIYCPPHPTKTNLRQYRFDTWHPALQLNDASMGGTDEPPFRAPDYGPGRHRALKAIQIKITFFDTTSQQLRDVTFVKYLGTEDN